MDSRAVWEVLSAGPGLAPTYLGDEEEGRDYGGWNGSVTKKSNTGRDHFDENREFSLGHVEVWVGILFVFFF